MGHLERKQTAVENVVAEYTCNVRETLSRVKRVHHQELEKLARQYEQDRSGLVKDYGRLSHSIKSLRTAESSKDETQTYEEWRRGLNQRLQGAKNKLLKS